MSLRAAAGIVSLMLCANSISAAAQSAAEVARLEALRDSLERAADPAAVAAFASDWRGETPEVLRRLRRGLLALRLGRLAGEREPLDEAVHQFEEAVFDERDWPYPRFALALARLALSEGRFISKPTAFHPVGTHYYEGFVDDLERSFVRDSTFPPVVDFLADLLSVQGDRAQPERFLRVLHAAARSGEADPRIDLVLGRAYRIERRPDSALALFEAYELHGGDRSVARLERARTLHALGRVPEAVDAYLAGLDMPTGEGRAFYRRDLAWVATPEELAEYDSLPTTALREWVGSFWTTRDAVAIREPGERLREHLRRWNHVHRHFRVVHPERRTQFERVRLRLFGPCVGNGEQSLDDLTYIDPARLDDVRRRERLLDHRAAIYMRHGEPARRVSTTGFPGSSGEPSVDRSARQTQGLTGGSDEAEPDFAGPPENEKYGDSYVASGRANESWQYWIDGRGRIFHFIGHTELGLDQPTTMVAVLPFDYNLMMARVSLDPAYRRMAGRLVMQPKSVPLHCLPSVQRLIIRDRRDMVLGAGTDTHTLLFPDALDPIIQVFAVGRPAAGTGRLLVVYALPGDRLRPDSLPAADAAGAALSYTVELRVVAIDSATGAVHRTGAARTFGVRDTLRAGAHLSGVLELPLPAGVHQARVAVLQPGGERGGAVVREGLRLERDPSALALSDLVPGREGGGVSWTTGGERVPLNPLDAFPRSEAASLYYELSGLRTGRTYATTVSLQRLKERDPSRALRLHFSEVASGPVQQTRRTLALGTLRPGQYRMTVTVEEVGTGRTIERERIVNVVER